MSSGAVGAAALDENATMSLPEFCNLMKDCRMLGHRQTRVIFTASQAAKSADAAKGGRRGVKATNSLDGGSSMAAMSVGTYNSNEAVDDVEFFAKVDTNNDGLDDDDNEFDFGEFLESLVRCSLWKYHEKHDMTLPQKIEMGLGVVAGLYGKKRQSQRAVSSGLGGGGGGGGKTRGGGDAMSKLRTTRYF